MHTVQIPKLPTLNQTPSWVNCNNRIDRCASVEVRAQDVWKDAIIDRPAPTRDGRISTKIVMLTAPWLASMHDERMPRQLAGDLRTAQANAMRPANLKPSDHIRRRGLVEGELPPFADYGLHHNPNRGASREKMIGINEVWRQPLRLELWKIGRGLNKHFLICPHPRNCPPIPDDWEEAERSLANDDQDEHEWKRETIDESDPRLPHLSTIERGSKLNLKTCAQRVSKLFLVSCTQQELSDARTAQLWIGSLSQGLAGKHIESVNVLVGRYGFLFSPRRMLCQRCLGVRYNQGPERRRREYAREKGREFGTGPGQCTLEVKHGLFGDYVARPIQNQSSGN